MAKSSPKFGVVLACCLVLGGAGLVTCRALSARLDEPGEVGPPAAQAADRPRTGGGTATRVDCWGDPLPPHALARMGTTRLFYHGKENYPSRALAFSPDGRTLATHIDGMTVCLWDAATGKEIRRLTAKNVKGNIHWLGFSRDGKTLAAVNGDQTICRWEAATGKFLHKREYQGPKRDNLQRLRVAFLPDGQILGFADFFASVEEGRGMYVWDVAAGKELRRLGDPMKRDLVWGRAFSPDGKVLATSVRGKKEAGATIILWDVAAGKEIRRLAKEEGGVSALAFSPDGKTLASEGAQQKVCVWDVATGKKTHQFQAPLVNEHLLAYSPDGKTLFAGREGHLWETATAKEIRSFGWKDVHAAVFSPNGKTLAVADTMGAIRLWDIAAGREIGPRQGFRGRIQWLAYSPDGKTLASLGTQIWGMGGNEKTVRLWETATGKEIGQLAKGSSSVAYAPDGKTLVSITGVYDRALHLWDTATDKEIRQFEADDSCYLRSAAFSPDGKKLAARMHHEGMIYLGVWEVATGRKLFSLPTEAKDIRLAAKVELLAFSPDGRLLATEGKDNTVCLWEVATGARLRQLGEPRPSAQPWRELFVRFLAFSPDGRILATSSIHDDKVRLWDVASGKEVCRLDGYNQCKAERRGEAEWWGCSLAFSPDGRMLATAAQGRNCDREPDREVRLWEVASGGEVGRLIGHQAPVRTMTFSPDGKTLASGSDDLTCLIWDLASVGRLKPVPARSLAAQPLSPEQRESVWSDLGKEPARAYAAVAALQAAPAQAISLLRERLRPVAPLANAPQLQRWIADLDADRFSVRDAAQRQIEKLGEPALPALRQALKGQPSLEVKRRLQNLLAALEPQLVGGPSEHLRELRAVQVLESLGTTEARQLLQALAKGVTEARLTVEAESALARLAKRSAAGF